MESKAVVKLGTFIRNLLTTNTKFRDIREEFGFDQYTAPEYVFKIVNEELSKEERDEIIQHVSKSPVKEYVAVFQQENCA